MKNIDNRKLIIVLIGLLGGFVVLKIFRSPGLERNLPSALVEIDSAKLKQLIIRPAVAPGQEIRLLREAKGWQLRNGEQLARLEQGGVESALRSLLSLRPQSMVSKRKEKWSEFQVSDSTGTRVRAVDTNDREVLNLWIGRTGLSQGAVSEFVPGYVGAITYVRLDNENKVYTVDGSLSSQFNRKFDDWRDKSFLRLKPDSIARVEFFYPNDTSFVLDKRNGKWMSGEKIADSVRIRSFLSDLQYKNIGSFAEATPSEKPDVVINFIQSSGGKTTIEAWRNGAVWTLRSTLQRGVLFSSEEAGVKDLLKGKRTFDVH